MSRLLTMTVAVVLMALTGTASADTILQAVMTNAGESSPTVPTLQNGITPRPASFGAATFVLNTAQTSMTMSAQVFNIDFTGTQTATTNAGVVWGFIGTPLNDISPNDVVVTPFAAGVGGTVTAKWDASEGNNTTLTAQLPNILSTHSYINFHTSQFGGGEIRGFLVPVPEPSTVALLACGLVGMAGWGWRRQRQK
jgi:hypothetical protein